MGAATEQYMSITEYSIVSSAIYKEVQTEKWAGATSKRSMFDPFFDHEPNCLICIAASLKKREEMGFPAFTSLIWTYTFHSIVFSSLLSFSNVHQFCLHTSRIYQHLYHGKTCTWITQRGICVHRLCGEGVVPTAFFMASIQQLQLLSIYPMLYCLPLSFLPAH